MGWSSIEHPRTQDQEQTKHQVHKSTPLSSRTGNIVENKMLPQTR